MNNINFYYFGSSGESLSDDYQLLRDLLVANLGTSLIISFFYSYFSIWPNFNQWTLNERNGCSCNDPWEKQYQYSTSRSYLIWCLKLLTIHAQIQRRIGFWTFSVCSLEGDIVYKCLIILNVSFLSNKRTRPTYNELYRIPIPSPIPHQYIPWYPDQPILLYIIFLIFF